MVNWRMWIGFALALAVALATAGEETVTAAPDPPSEIPLPADINASFLSQELDVDRYVGIFEAESREIFAERQAIVAALGLEPGDAVADVGAGTGFFSVLFAEAVGREGAVYAVEVSPKFLDHLRGLAQGDGLGSLKVVEGTAHSVELAEGSVDVAFVCDVYHHFEHPADSLASLQKALRPGGSLVVIDFERIPGVSRDFVFDHVRAGKAVFRSEIEAAGFEFAEEVEIEGLSENYTLRFRRP